MFQLLKSQRGFSMVQGMVLAGVVAGSSLVVTRLLNDQKLAQRSAETRDEVERLHQAVYGYLQSKENCVVAIPSATGNSLITGTNPASPTRITLTTVGSIIKVIDSTADSKYMHGHVTISSIETVYPIYNPARTAIRPGYGRVHIKYQRLAPQGDLNKRSHGSGYGAKDIEKTVLLRVQRTGTTYDSCYAVADDNTAGLCSLGVTYTTQADCATAGGTWTPAAGETGNNDLIKKFCEELNSEGVVGTSMFVWDEASSTCRPRDNACRDDGEVNMGIDSNGMAVCKPLLDVLDLSTVIDNSGVAPCPAGAANPRFEVFTVSTPQGPAQRVRIRCN